MGVVISKILNGFFERHSMYMCLYRYEKPIHSPATELRIMFNLRLSRQKVCTPLTHAARRIYFGIDCVALTCYD